MSEKISITASFLFTLDEVKKGTFAHSTRRTRDRMIVSILLIISIGILIKNRTIERIFLAISSWTASEIILGGLILTFYLFIVLQENASLKKAFAQRPESNKQIEYKFSQNEIVS